MKGQNDLDRVFLRKWLNRIWISLAHRQNKSCLQDYMFLDFALGPREACPSLLKFWPPGGAPV